MKSLYVNYTAVPSQVPRQLAIEILHSHGEIITLNPLVIDYKPIKPPRDAENDEFYATWYEITQQIKIMPGLGKMGSSKVSFKGVFHDMPWGIQTHTYIPLGIELRHKWQVRGNQPGEPPEPRELGSKAPSDGLYLQENVEIDCNPLALSFVKKELKAASKVMIERMMKKAELLDAGVLQAMFEDGKLKTINPADKTNLLLPSQPNTPGLHSPDMRYRPMSSVSSNADSHAVRESQWGGSQYGGSQQSGSNTGREPPYTSAGSHRGSGQNMSTQGAIPNPDGSGLAIEMMGDTHYYPDMTHLSLESKQNLRPELPADSVPAGNDGRWSFGSSDNRSNISGPSQNGSYVSPDPRGSISELPAAKPMPEMSAPSARPSPGPYHGPGTPPPGQPRYNPQDYAPYAPGRRYP